LHPSARIFVFGDFNVHHSDWLPHSHGTTSSGFEVFNFSISQSLTQLIDFPTRFPDRADQSPSLLDLFLTSESCICKTSSGSILGKSDHAVVNVDISFGLNTSHDPPIHKTFFSFHCGQWDDFRDLLRDIPWDEVFQLPTEECAKEISSWLQAGIDAFIPSQKYHARPHSSPWFSPACEVAIAHRNQYFHLYRRCDSEVNRRLFTSARNQCRRVILDARSDYKEKVHERLIT
jgi:hypothetical protein